MTFEQARAAFPVLERFAYLNTGSVGPLSRSTHDAIAAELRRGLGEGRGSVRQFERILELREELRRTVADLVGVAPESVALTCSTTDGCNVVMRGLDLRPDDEIVTTDVEHFGLLGPLHVSGARVRVAAVRELPADAAYESIRAEITPRTRLLALSHVAWTSGHALPVRELKEATGLPILVDGAQAVGAIPVDASGFDFYTVSGQKWLCGPDTSGALVVAAPESLRVAAPGYLSQASYEPDGSFEPKPGAARFDSQWISHGSLRGLVTAIREAPAWRFDRAREAADRCRALLAERFDVVTEPGHGTLVAWKPDGDAAEAARRCYDLGVVIRDLPGTGWLRASCGYWTSDEDLDRLLAAL